MGEGEGEGEEGGGEVEVNNEEVEGREKGGGNDGGRRRKREKGRELLRLGLVTSLSSYTGSVLEVISCRIGIESVVQVVFDM